MTKTSMIASLLIAVSLAPAAGRADAKVPQPGDPAPPVVASRWLRGGPVARFEPGRVYVVDFWSTWCKPCLDAMPALKNLERDFADRATFVAMDVWEFDPRRVDDFLKDRGDDLLAVAACDSVPDGAEPNAGLTAAAYLGTSEGATIPKTFIVDRAGRIAWIGVPDDLVGPLMQVLDDER